MLQSQAYPYCPRCSSPLHRCHRSGIERLISHVIRRRPYFCKENHCHWRGWRSFSTDLPVLAIGFMTQTELIEEGKWQRLTKATLHPLPDQLQEQPASLSRSHHQDLLQG